MIRMFLELGTAAVYFCVAWATWIGEPWSSAKMAVLLCFPAVHALACALRLALERDAGPA
jgi:hypothetical protein